MSEFSFREEFFLRKDFLLWHSNCRVHSSVKKTSLKHSYATRHLLTQATLFCLFASWMAWQYRAVVKVQPSSLHTIAIVLLLYIMFSSQNLVVSNVCNSEGVHSSFSAMVSSMKR